MPVPSKVSLKNSISTKLLRVVFSLYILIAIAVTIVHMVAEYHYAKDSILHELKGLQPTFEAGLGRALWEFNTPQLQLTIEGIAKIPIIVGAKIEDTTGSEIIAVGTIMDQMGDSVMIHENGERSPFQAQVFSELMSYTFPLKYIDDYGDTTPTGMGTFYSSTAMIWQKVKYGFFFIVLNSLIKTTALWIIFLWVAHSLLSRPLNILTDATHKIEMDNLENVEIDVKTSGRNELKVLEEAFNGMIKKLRLAKEVIRENARMEGELKTAAAVQHALFPRKIPQVENLKLAGFFQSASETGGDWYGFLSGIGNSLYIMIGDVTGHGTPAAIVTATASATCKTIEKVYSYTKGNRRKISPSKILQNLNKSVLDAGYSEFLMTFFIAKIDLTTGLMVFANAAHNFPIVIRKDGKLKHLLAKGTLLGKQESVEFREEAFQLEEGDLIFFYTDGLIENENQQGKMWGEQRLVRCLRKHKGLPVEELVRKVVQENYVFCDNRGLIDDVTIVACHVTEPFSDRLSSK